MLFIFICCDIRSLEQAIIRGEFTVNYEKEGSPPENSLIDIEFDD